MKKIYYFFGALFFIYPTACLSQNVIFLHHSVGNSLFSGGQVKEWFTNYNLQYGKSISITERSYPNTPYTWDNYAYDYWNLWINGQCNSDNPNIECLTALTQSYDVIIVKHCYVGSGVRSESGEPSVSSSRRTLGNYKLQYRALLSLFDQYPNKKFIVWTLVPQHRLLASTENAERARQFVEWVKNEWLYEDGKTHNNVFLFDFWSLAAVTDPDPEPPSVYNTLKYDYEKSHIDDNSHPNELANQTIGPIFAQFIADVINNTNIPTGLKEPNQKQDKIADIYISQNKLIIREISGNFYGNLAITDLTGEKKIVKPISLLKGEILEINLDSLDTGLYFATLYSNSQNQTEKFVIPR